MDTNQQWQVYSLDAYATFQMDDTEDVGFAFALLIPLDNTHKSNGAFRVLLFGGQNEPVTIEAHTLFPNLPPPIADASLHIPCGAETISFPDNCTASQWGDAETLIRH